MRPMTETRELVSVAKDHQTGIVTLHFWLKAGGFRILKRLQVESNGQSKLIELAHDIDAVKAQRWLSWGGDPMGWETMIKVSEEMDAAVLRKKAEIGA